MDLSPLGRLLVVMGLTLAVLGIAILLGPRIPWIGRLPGDFAFGGEHWKVYVPLGTCLVLSLLLSLVLAALSRR
ncbi:MAG TPA: DUF2905 domain-containing protein [Candidatus Eisenbacteria bacterium]|jgi:hypothetical protein